jgi:RNA polymerase sigma-70 factor (ECF subfamily)
MDITVDDAATGRPNLVKLARAGDQEAFRRLVEPELATALRSASLVLGSEADAADVVQDALISAWRHLGSLRQPDAFRAWFRRIVVRETLRKAKSRRTVSQIDERESDPSASVERALEQRQLARAFRALDADDRAILTLRHLLRLNISEVAETLGIPEGTVKSRTHQAMVRIRSAYEAEDRR